MTPFVLLTLLLTSMVINAASLPSFDKQRDSCFFNSAACCFGPDQHPWVQTEPRCKFNDTTQSYPCSVKLGASNQVGSIATAHVAKVFIEEFLGYPVEIEALTDHVSTANQHWELLEKGTIDALLDVPGSLELEDEFVVKRRTVKSAGSLGFSETLGWYVPSYMTVPCTASSANPSCETSMALSESWLALTVPSNIEKLRNKAQLLPCCSSDNYETHCMPDATLGGTPVKAGGLHNSSVCEAEPTRLVPSYGGRLLTATRTSTKFEKAVIDQLRLNLTIEFVGTEHELVRQLEAAQDNEEGILMLLSSSHPIVQRYNLTKINLPSSPYTCSFNSGNTRHTCEYQADYSRKVYRKPLFEDMPDLARVLELFRFSSSTERIDIVSSVLFDESSFLDSACTSIKSQLPKWETMFEDVEQLFNGTFDQGKQPTLKVVNCGCIGNGSQRLVEVWETEDFWYSHVVSDPDPCQNPTYSSYSSRWTELSFPTETWSLEDCEHAELTSFISIIALAVAVFACLVLLFAMGLVVYLRDEPHMKASNIMTIITFLLGAICMNVFSAANIGHVTYTSCLVRAALVVYGCGWFIGALFVKEVALFIIFFVGGKYNAYTAAWLKYQILICAAITTIPFLLWALVGGFEPKLNTRMKFPGQRVWRCPEGTTTKFFMSVTAIVILLLSCYMSYMTRGISGTFTEGKNVLFTAYLIAVLGVLMSIVLPMSGLRREYSILISEVAIAAVTLTTAAGIIGPRVYSYWFGHKFDRNELYKVKTAQVVQRAQSKPRFRTTLPKPVEASVFEVEMADGNYGGPSTNFHSNESQAMQQRARWPQGHITLS